MYMGLVPGEEPQKTHIESVYPDILGVIYRLCRGGRSQDGGRKRTRMSLWVRTWSMRATQLQRDSLMMFSSRHSPLAGLCALTQAFFNSTLGEFRHEPNNHHPSAFSAATIRVSWAGSPACVGLSEEPPRCYSSTTTAGHPFPRHGSILRLQQPREGLRLFSHITMTQAIGSAVDAAARLQLLGYDPRRYSDSITSRLCDH